VSVRHPVAGLRDLLRSPSDVRTEDPWELPPRRPAVLAATVVIGGLVLAWSLRVPPGDPLFYVGTLATALVWVAGAVVSEPTRSLLVLWSSSARPSVGRRSSSSLAVRSLVLGLLLVGVFLVAGLAVGQVPVLARPVRHLLDHADGAWLPLVAVLTAVNGVAEELFFRGALYAGVRRHDPVLVTTLVYVVVTAASGIPLLVLAAAVIGVVTALQRRATGGLLAPTVTHVTWSLGMLLLLPPLLDAAG
jgi:membrane protease YdiL (CAAX protease family)